MFIFNQFSFSNRINKILLILLLFSISSDAQKNLVPNPSFELYTIACDSMNAGMGGATNWKEAVIHPIFKYAYDNSCSTNSCCGVPYNTFGSCYQYAHSGNGYIGFYFYYIPSGLGNLRDYVQTQLLKSLTANKCYYIEFYVNQNEFYAISTNNVALLVGDTAIYSDSNKYTPAIPQIQQYGNPIISDTMNWVKVAGIYTAHGGEQFITIGNFNDDSHTATTKRSIGFNAGCGNFIDDVSVIPLDSMFIKADAGRDTTIVNGDSVWIGSRMCGLQNVVWYNESGNIIDTGAPGLWVKPISNTFYVIEQNVCGQYSRDTVFIAVVPLPVVIKNYELRMEYKIQWRMFGRLQVR